MKSIQVLMLVAGLVGCGAAAAVEEHWHPINESITAMLNEGWIVQHYASPNRDHSGQETFILEKNGEYVRCTATTTLVKPPSIFAKPAEEHVESDCEALN